MEAISTGVDQFVKYVSSISVAVAIIAFFGIILHNRFKGYPINLEDLLLRTFAASAIPKSWRD